MFSSPQFLLFIGLCFVSCVLAAPTHRAEKRQFLETASQAVQLFNDVAGNNQPAAGTQTTPADTQPAQQVQEQPVQQAQPVTTVQEQPAQAQPVQVSQPQAQPVQAQEQIAQAQQAPAAQAQAQPAQAQPIPATQPQAQPVQAQPIQPAQAQTPQVQAQPVQNNAQQEPSTQSTTQGQTQPVQVLSTPNQQSSGTSNPLNAPLNSDPKGQISTQSKSVPIGPKCANTQKRRAWHTFAANEKQNYLQAVQCLQQRRGITGAPGAQTRFDDIVAVHQLQASWVHLDGWFLPFHRYYTWTYEKLLRDECGFQGAHPYWDEPLDAGNFMHSVLLDPNVGFGGNGAGGTSATGEANCVRDGPFASYTAHIGPAYQVTDHCLARTVNEEISKMSSQGSVDACLSQTNFVEVWKCIEYGPHVGGHLGIGGTMDDAVASPNDPLFFVHHAFIDRIWWQWQQQDPVNRINDFGGYTTSIIPAGGWINATLDDEMDMHNLVPKAKIRDLMDTAGQTLCYEYV